MTVGDVLRLDPFGNESLLFELSGEEVKRLLIECRAADGYAAPYVSGITYLLTVDKKDLRQVRKLQISDEHGAKWNLKKDYTVMVSSYVAAICPLLQSKERRQLYTKTADLIIRYLSKQPSVNYQGCTRFQ